MIVKACEQSVAADLVFPYPGHRYTPVASVAMQAAHAQGRTWLDAMLSYHGGNLDLNLSPDDLTH